MFFCHRKKIKDGWLREERFIKRTERNKMAESVKLISLSSEAQVWNFAIQLGISKIIQEGIDTDWAQTLRKPLPAYTLDQKWPCNSCLTCLGKKMKEIYKITHPGKRI